MLTAYGRGVHAYLALVLLHSDAGDTLFASILLKYCRIPYFGILTQNKGLALQWTPSDVPRRCPESWYAN